MMGKSRKNVHNVHILWESKEQKNHYFTQIGVAHTHTLAHSKVECDFENGKASYDIRTYTACRIIFVFLCIIVVEAAL